jgi:hypothetical protein
VTIQPTNVYPPGPFPGAGRRFYSTYNTRNINPPSPPPGPAPGRPGFNYNGGFLYRQFQRVPGGGQQVQTPGGVPRFFGNRSLILLAWVAAMAMVSLDEWHTYGILPRPARLWYTTTTYLLIAAASTVDALVPICSIFAIGLTITLAYQYYSGTGQFGSYGAQEVKASEGAGGVNS